MNCHLLVFAHMVGELSSTDWSVEGRFFVLDGVVGLGSLSLLLRVLFWKGSLLFLCLEVVDIDFALLEDLLVFAVGVVVHGLATFIILGPLFCVLEGVICSDMFLPRHLPALVWLILDVTPDE